jgi:hypothetical protein
MPGSPRAGPKVSAILSVVESCRRLQVSVRDYFAAVLPGFANLPIQRLPDLTPVAWVVPFFELAFSMHLFVAVSAKRDQVLLLVIACLAPKFEVMHLQALHATATLAPPAVALQHLPPQLAVVCRIKSQSRSFPASFLHETLRLTSERKASCCETGRNL